MNSKIYKFCLLLTIVSFVGAAYYKQYPYDLFGRLKRLQEDVSEIKNDIKSIKLKSRVTNASVSENKSFANYIHFIETTIGSNELNNLQKCAIESAKRHNPNSEIILWSFERKKVPTGIENRIFDWKKRAAKYFNVSNFEKKLSTNHVYRTSHLSDLCRYIILMEYGGLYLDIDVISLERYVPMNRCMLTIVRQEDEKLGTGAIYADKPGDPIFDNILYKLDEFYNGNDWETIGPVYISFHVKYQCKLNSLADVSKCGRICILPAKTFSPFSWNSNEIMNIYNEQSSNYVLPSETIGIHVYNKRTSSLNANIHTASLFAKIAELNCPDVGI